jgi:hypothetical protein
MVIRLAFGAEGAGACENAAWPQAIKARKRTVDFM